MSFKGRMEKLANPSEYRTFQRLSTPKKIQNYLDTIPINFELKGETNMSPRRVLRAKTAHCLEGAVFAAAVLAYHGQKPLLMDFRTTPNDEDHVVALFRLNGHWGAISKTNHSVLRYRDALYKSPRELAMSYFHEYLLWSGRKSLLEYSAPFDLSQYKPERWVTAENDLDWLVEALDDSRHFPTVPQKNRRELRNASEIELRAMKLVEWKAPKKFKQRG